MNLKTLVCNIFTIPSKY